MTTDTPRETGLPDITIVLAGVMPDLRRAQARGWAMAAGLLGAGGVLAWGVSTLSGNNVLLAIFIMIAAVVLTASVAAHVRRRHQALILPLMTQAAGLSYDQDGLWFLDSLPPRLLPTSRKRTCADLISGRIGGRDMRFAAVRIESGGEDTTIYFEGSVMAFPNVVPMPAFLVAAEKETRDRLFSKGNIRVDDLVRVQTLTGHSGEEYGVWCASADAARAPGFGAVMEVLTGLETIINPDAKLYTASSNGREMHLTISHKRELFGVGGMFAGRAALMQDIRAAYDDLTLPMRIVQALLTAEAEVAKAAGAQAAAV